MQITHFCEDRKNVLTQLLSNPPSIGEEIKVKGRKGKIIEIRDLENNHIQVNVEFEQIKMRPVIENKKKK